VSDERRFTSDAVLGCLVGGAIGDAIGGTAERGEVSLSDDTQLTLATCEAILAGGADPAGVAAAMAMWFTGRRVTGLGAATLKALRDLAAGGHWALSGARGEMAAGNGAAMRIAPLAFVVDPWKADGRVLIRDVCRITHHSDEAYVGGLAVIAAIHLGPQQRLLANVVASLPDSRCRDRLAELSTVDAAAPIAMVASSFGASGWVVDTVPLALLLSQRLVAGNFSGALKEAAAITGDMDTVCSIAGQVAGAHMGHAALPRELLVEPAVRAILPQAQTFAQAIGR
jgi:ADP-ribosylglycohydrolase